MTGVTVAGIVLPVFSEKKAGMSIPGYDHSEH